MILGQTSIRQLCKKMFLNYFLSTADMMKCYKGHRHSATENVFYNFPHHLARSPMSTKSTIGTGCEAIKMDENEDMGITDEKLTAVYSLVVDVSDRVREKVRGKEWEGVRGERES